MNSKAKGKRGEREGASAWASATGSKSRRGVQYQGGQDSPDVVTDIGGVHLEVKRTESLRLYESVEQSERDAGGKVPVVLHRRNRGEWLAIVPLNRLAELSRLIVSYASKPGPNEQETIK